MLMTTPQLRYLGLSFLTFQIHVNNEAQLRQELLIYSHLESVLQTLVFSVAHKGCCDKKPRDITLNVVQDSRHHDSPHTEFPCAAYTRRRLAVIPGDTSDNLIRATRNYG